VNQTRISGLVQLGELLKSQGDSLSEFFRNDPRGQIIPDYLADLAGHLQEEQSAVLCEVGKLVKNVEHIKNIVDLQQSYARAGGVMETLDVVDLVEDAIGINSASLTRHRISIEKHYEPGPKLVCGDKSKILQILVNLIRNAKHAVDEGEPGNRQIRVFVRDDGQENLRITVQDTGVGISAANMTKLFTHGFTTRKHGHGFGLHSSESAAREMGGALTAQSDGPGLGASFTLELKSVHPQSPTSTRTPEDGIASNLVLSA
jgi:signal transduction histidine kinase